MSPNVAASHAKGCPPRSGVSKTKFLIGMAEALVQEKANIGLGSSFVDCPSPQTTIKLTVIKTDTMMKASKLRIGEFLGGSPLNSVIEPIY